MTRTILTFAAGAIATGIGFGAYQIVGPQVLVSIGALCAVSAFAIVYLGFNRGGLLDEPLSDEWGGR